MLCSLVYLGPCECLVPWKPEKLIRSIEIGDMGIYEPPWGCWKSNPIFGRAASGLNHWLIFRMLDFHFHMASLPVCLPLPFSFSGSHKAQDVLKLQDDLELPILLPPAFQVLVLHVCTAIPSSVGYGYRTQGFMHAWKAFCQLSDTSSYLVSLSMSLCKC